MIELKHVSKLYKIAHAVSDISFNVQQGQTAVLLGTSGCGKTTTLRMVNRLTEPSAGEILVNNINILHQPPDELRRGMGYVLQHTGLFPHYTIAENIGIVPRLMKWNEKKIKERTMELLHKLQLDPATYAHQYPWQLSGGQQQRVGLARALAADPPVLLMDEPFGALDPVTRAGIRKEFLHLDELKKKTILMVTHDVHEAFELGDMICLMDKGKIVQMGSPSDLLFKPANEFVQNFFAGQQFQMGLKSITLTDIWETLEKTDHIENAFFIDPGADLMQVMELISGQPDSIKYFIAEHNNETRALTLPAIFSAFAHFKKQAAHG